MIRRLIFCAFVVCSSFASRARGQIAQPHGTSTANAVAYAAPWVAYGVLSVGAIATLLNLPSDAPADTGRRVRVRTANGGQQTGRVIGFDANGLTISTESGQVIGAVNPTDVDVSLGRRGRWAQGWGIGFVAGATSGAVIGLTSGDDTTGDSFRFTAGEKAVIAGAALAIVGSTLGTVIGLAGPERWVHAIQPVGPGRMSVTPVIGPRLGLSAKIAF